MGKWQTTIHSGILRLQLHSILVMACLYQFCKVQIIFNNLNDRNFYMQPLSKVFNKHELIFRASLWDNYYNYWHVCIYCCYCCWVTSVVSISVWPHRRQPTRLPCPWDFPSKITGVGCHFLLLTQRGIFLIQRLNPSLLHCRKILYHLSHQGSLRFFII